MLVLCEDIYVCIIYTPCDFHITLSILFFYGKSIFSLFFLIDLDLAL